LHYGLFKVVLRNSRSTSQIVAPLSALVSEALRATVLRRRLRVRSKRADRVSFWHGMERMVF